MCHADTYKWTKLVPYMSYLRVPIESSMCVHLAYMETPFHLYLCL